MYQGATNGYRSLCLTKKTIMNPKIVLVLRIVFGLFLILFGSNKFFNFMPAPPEMPEAVMNYMMALMGSKTLPLVGLVEVLAGISLLFNRYAALMMLILMSVSINAVMFHATLAPEGIVPSVVLLVLNMVMLYAYRDKYAPLLQG